MRFPRFYVDKLSLFLSEHLETAQHTPLSNLNSYLAEFPEKEPFFLHCAGGYRSVIAASILKSRGIHNLIDVAGGFGALKKEGLTLEKSIGVGDTMTDYPFLEMVEFFFVHNFC